MTRPRRWARTRTGRNDQNPVTEEIDLDAEQARADAAAAARTLAGAKGRPKPNPLNLTTSSPFELSEADIGVVEPAVVRSQDAGPLLASPAPRAAETDSSSDFDLTRRSARLDPTSAGDRVARSRRPCHWSATTTR